MEVPPDSWFPPELVTPESLAHERAIVENERRSEVMARALAIHYGKPERDNAPSQP